MPFELIEKHFSGQAVTLTDLVVALQSNSASLTNLLLKAQTQDSTYSLPKLGWFGSIFDALNLPALNVPSLSIWITKFYAGSGSGKIVSSLSKLLPRHKLVQVIAAEFAAGREDDSKVFDHAAYARQSQRSTASADQKLLSLMVNAIAIQQGKVLEVPSMRDEQLNLILEWRDFVTKNAVDPNSLPKIQMVHLWAIFLIHDLTKDAMQIAQSQLSNERLTKTELEDWRQRVSLASDRSIGPKISVSELIADPRYIIDRNLQK